MADEDPWGTGEDDTPAAPEPTPAVTAGGEPPAADGAGDERPEADVPPQEDPFRRPVTLYRHWVR